MSATAASAAAAEEALAKAKAIAAKLKATTTSSPTSNLISGGSGSGSVSSTSNYSSMSHINNNNNDNDVTYTNTVLNPMDIAKAAEAALASAGLEGPKRKRWSDHPPSPSNERQDKDEFNTAKRSKQQQQQQQQLYEAQKRMWISTSNKPAAHYRLYWEIHGPSILRQVSAGDIQLTLAGRGSSKIPALPGIPEQPLHLLIEGPTLEACENAEHLVETLFVVKANDIETMVDDDEPPAPPAALTNGSSSSEGYRPAPVASLIHNTGIAVGATLMEEQIGVPNGIVGFIIGRGGESIASMQARTGCKVQIQKENEMQPGQTLRVITLQATTKDAIDDCRSIIEGMVSERTQTTTRDVTNDIHSQEQRLQEAVQAGHIVVTVAVPDSDVGLIIGKAGSTIKSIQDRTGANIQIPQSGDIDNPSIRTVSVTHPHAEGANLAKQLIEDILGSKRNQAPHVTIQVEIPDKDVGMCIGRSGCVIREMQNQSGTKIQIPSFSTPGMQIRIATVTGPPEGCERVKQMIERIVLEQSSQSVMSGSGIPSQGYDPYSQNYAMTGQQQPYIHNSVAAYGSAAVGYGGVMHQGYMDMHQAHTPTMTQDYSKEWAAYYAAQAAIAPASTMGDPTATLMAATTTTATGGTSVLNSTTTTSTATTTTTPDTYYEQFFRYAYYYGEEAARTYYGAWSPPPGTPNPYGINPNGITAAPAEMTTATTTSPYVSTSATVAPSAAMTSVAPTDTTTTTTTTGSTSIIPPNVRDSGRRGVSNLPAWMTKG